MGNPGKTNARSKRVAIVCGGRDVNPTPDELVELHAILEGADIEVVRTGGATGVDTAVHEHVRDIWERESVPADWERHGKRAGPLRNKAMLTKDVVLIVAWPGGSGTQDMIERALKAGAPVRRIGCRTEPEATPPSAPVSTTPGEQRPLF